ncbi:pantetheinase-like [Saccoglossus kowalevskii]|uniref:Pantetheinase-like n=1 Tax=Saccoglossus kowalevskii TaxID=10224 RepID=A0ABM0GPE9_SACKO|nr:PREDICTED: pantetheinase-like [Saccoglossus kowalevskii]
MKLFLWLYLLVCTIDVYDSALLRDNGYVAAVYEHVAVVDPDTYHHVTSREKALKLMNQNLDIYDEQTKIAASKGAQIIVFPEYGLFSWDYDRNTILPFLESVPSPYGKNINPCEDVIRFNATKVLRRLSCIAKSHSVVIVAGMGAVTHCNPVDDAACPPDDRYQYNAAVVFDSDGKLIARYYKVNLFAGEKNTFNAGTVGKTNYGVFHTSFGSFAIIICYDMLFSKPSLQLIYDENIKNIVFPTAWVNCLPTLTAVGIQNAWAMGHGVNLLASNLHLPKDDATGSGIFSSVSGALKYHHDMATSNPRLLISHVPAIQGDHRCCTNDDKTGMRTSHIESPLKFTPETDETFYGIMDNDLFTFVLLNEDIDSISVCDGWLCCNLSYSKQPENYSTDLYALGVFNGFHTAYSKFYLQICALIRCAGDDPSRCGAPVSTATTVFKKFSLTGNFDPGVYLFPIVLTNHVQLPAISKWHTIYPYDHIWSEGELDDPLVSSVIYGRWFDRDP